MKKLSKFNGPYIGQDFYHIFDFGLFVLDEIVDDGTAGMFIPQHEYPMLTCMVRKKYSFSEVRPRVKSFFPASGE